MKRRRPRAAAYYRQVEASEKRLIEKALDKTAYLGWNVSAAARSLAIPLSTLKYKMRKLKLKRP